MILLVHMLFGVAIGLLFHNPTIAVIAAFLSHYFLDLFPHIEYLDSTEELSRQIKTGQWQRKIPDIIKVFFDFLAGFLLVFLFSDNSVLAYACAAAAVIPDGLTVINFIVPNKITAIHHKIHGEKIQYLTKQKKSPIFWRVAIQVAAVIIAIILLI